MAPAALTKSRMAPEALTKSRMAPEALTKSSAMPRCTIVLPPTKAGIAWDATKTP